MYKSLLLLVLLVGLVAAHTSNPDAHAHTEKDIKKNDGHGHFQYGFDTTNGIGADEAGDEHQVHGEFHFNTKEGVPVKITYTADENGYHPHGDSIPTPPPTPAAILKALEYIRTHPKKDQEHAKH